MAGRPVSAFRLGTGAAGGRAPLGAGKFFKLFEH